MTLNEMKIGSSAVIRQVGGEGALRCRLLDMGLIPGTKVTLQKVAPMGDPMEIRVRGYELTLRVDDARQIHHGAAFAVLYLPHLLIHRHAGEVAHMLV